MTRTNATRRAEGMAAPRDFSLNEATGQLTRILESDAFSKAPVLRRLLQFLVEQTLQGRAHELKEYAIGVDVFDRGDKFDPRIDTIVRVQARRLRTRLEEYYDGPGRDDPIVIDLPKGSYAIALRPPTRSRIDLLSKDQLWKLRSSVPDVIEGAPLACSVPAARTPLIGRDADLANLKRMLLSDDVRLLTLTGVGGSGKTRLAVEAASRSIGEFPGGVLFVSVAGISEPAGVTSTLAQIFRLRQTDGRLLTDALQDHVRLSVHVPTLLVLDNFEHVLPAAHVLVALLDASRSLKILVTSRAVLRVYGEHDYSVSPLALPDPTHLSDLATLRENPAVALFVSRATAVDREFALTMGNVAAVAQVCCRLDGLPLAIELAAARVKTLPPRAMLTLLQNRLNLPGSGHRDVPPRQQTLRNTLDWSYELLSAGGQQLFRRLSVFAGGLTLEAAEAVCNARRDLPFEVVEGISSLIDESLLRQVADDTEPRFAMIETVREYALDLLMTSGEQEAIRRAHAAYCLVLAEEGNAASDPAERNDWLTLCNVECENFRAALDYLIAGGHAEWAQRLGVALHVFWDRLGHLAEGRAWLAAILALGGDEARLRQTWAKAACYAAGLASVQGDYDAMFTLHQAALQVYRALEDQKGIITELTGIGIAERGRGNYAAAQSWIEQSLEACRRQGDKWRTAAALSNLANVLSAVGDRTQARTRLEEASGLFRDLEDWSAVAWTFNHLGNIERESKDLVEAGRAYQQGLTLFRQVVDKCGIARSCADLGYLACERQDCAAACAAFAEALRVFQALDNRHGIIHVIEGFAVLSALQGQAERALTLGGAAAALRKTIGAAGREEPIKPDRGLEPVWKQLDDTCARNLWSAGSLLPLDDVIRLGLETVASASTESQQDPEVAGRLPRDPPESRLVEHAPGSTTHPAQSRCNRSYRP